MAKLIATIRQSLINVLAHLLNKWYNRLNNNPETIDIPTEDKAKWPDTIWPSWWSFLFCFCFRPQSRRQHQPSLLNTQSLLLVGYWIFAKSLLLQWHRPIPWSSLGVSDIGVAESKWPQYHTPHTGLHRFGVCRQISRNQKANKRLDNTLPSQITYPIRDGCLGFWIQ